MSKIMERRALGRAADLGSLYNAREECFLGTDSPAAAAAGGGGGGHNLFEALKAKYVKVEDDPHTRVQLSCDEFYSGRFQKLLVEPELRLSVLSGQGKPSAEYAKFLMEQAEELSSTTLIYHLRTKRQSLNLEDKRFRKYVSAQVLKTTTATHFVSGILWGANTFVSVVENWSGAEMAETKTWVRGQLEVEFLNTITAMAAGDDDGDDDAEETTQTKKGGEEREEEEVSLGSLVLEVYGDVFPISDSTDDDAGDRDSSSSVRHSFAEAKSLVKRTQKLVAATEGGKGKQVIYVLTPIVDIAREVGVRLDVVPIYIPIEPKWLDMMTEFFDDAFVAKRLLERFAKETASTGDDGEEGRPDAIRDRKKLIEIADRSMRYRLTKTLVAVRSGKVESRFLEGLIEELRGKGDNAPAGIRAFVDRQSKSVSKQKEDGQGMEKVTWIKGVGKRGIRYVWIGKDDETPRRTLRSELKNVGSCYLMVFTETEYKRKGEAWDQNMALFDKLVSEDEAKASGGGGRELFYMVEYEQLPPEVPPVVIERYMRGKRVSSDVLGDHVWFATNSLVSVRGGPHESGHSVPHFGVTVQLRCPRSIEENGGRCKADARQWKCVGCQSFLTYGRDDHFYCECGRAEVDRFEFKCSDEAHGVDFVAFRPEDDLRKTMKTLAGDLEEINILLLGETGVGKSTFINAFANYLTYDRLDQVEDSELIILIPASFTLIDEDYEERTVSVRPNFTKDRDGRENDDGDRGESLEAGASATQACKAYVFPFADKIVRLIDTPGIGDTRGVDQDKKNFDNILAFLGFHREIHGICILLKPNNARLSVFFRYCIQQLMFHLHKSASENITFVFTNARSTFYRPGDTLPALRKMLKEIKMEPPHVEIPFNQKTTFCLDNESFRFMVAVRNEINFTEEDRKNFIASWDTSVKECKRLLQHVSSRKPHDVNDTISVNDARRLIALLSQPIGDITQNIQENIFQLDIEMKKFESNTQEILELQKDLYIPVVKIAYVKLASPRTVCTSIKCPNAVKKKAQPPGGGGGGHHEPIVGGDLEERGAPGRPSFVTYSICCEPCWLGSMQVNSFWQFMSSKAPQGLRFCSSFHKVSGVCKKCGCDWKDHAHQFTEAKQTTHKIVNDSVDGKIKTKEEAMTILNEHVNNLRQRTVELEHEQVNINKIVATFAHFCVENAISPYNDAYKDYLDYLIKVKEAQAGNKTVVEGLKKAKLAYEMQLNTLQGAMKSHDAKGISPKDVSALVSDLYKLKHNGSMIKQTVEESRRAVDAMHVTYSEVVYAKGRTLVRAGSEGPSSAEALQGWVEQKLDWSTR